MQIVMPWSSYYTGCHQYIESGVVVVVDVVWSQECNVTESVGMLEDGCLHTTEITPLRVRLLPYRAMHFAVT